MKRLEQWLEIGSFDSVINCNEVPGNCINPFFLALARTKNHGGINQQVHCVHLFESSPVSAAMKQALRDFGWHIIDHASDLQDLPPDSVTLVLDELDTAFLPTIRKDQWKRLQNLLHQRLKILWVTSGSQFEVTKPNNALIHGLARTIRAEDPSTKLVTLDVEFAEGGNALRAIDRVLRTMHSPVPKIQVESEFVERRGIIYISRIQVDETLNKTERDEDNGTDLHMESLHDSKSCIRFRCERLGILDSLQYAHVSATELPLEADHFVEVEIFAAGLNFKVSILIALAILCSTNDNVSGHCSGDGNRP